MKKFWVEIPDGVSVALELAAVEAKAAGKFANPKKGGKKAMAELLLCEWAAQRGVKSVVPKHKPLFPAKRELREPGS